MALEGVGEKALVLSTSDNAKIVKPKKKVLDEDTYTEHLEKIIVRDFFPDLPKLQTQAEYLDALKNNDVEKLRQIHMKYGPKRGKDKSPSIYDTPSTFETPDLRSKNTPKETQTAEVPEGETPCHDEEQSDLPEPNTESDKDKKAPNLSLDKFLAKNTSEDNAAFDEIMVEAVKRHKEKHSWLFEQQKEQEKEKEQRLALPGIEQQAIENGSSKVQSWTYTPQNFVMYVPDGVEMTAKEKIDLAGSSREIVHPNTRFKAAPFDTEKNKKQLLEAAMTQAKTLQGRIGADGKEILPSATPKVNGYGFVVTPSPAPGVAESPMMTWGEIEGTPFRLDGSDTPLHNSAGQGPQFKIPEIPKRDKLALELAEKASKSHRMKKAQALKQVTANFASPSPKFGGASKSDRLVNLSPAAQRLASAKLGIRTNTDKALRASYTPSPSQRLAGDKTPLSLTPETQSHTPGSSRRTPRDSTLVHTPKRPVSQSGVSLTDNLLNLPKRSKAKDYF